MISLIDASYVSAALQGFLILGLIIWRLRAVFDGQYVTSRVRRAFRAAQVTLMVGMMLSWLHHGLNNGFYGLARIISNDYHYSRPDWVESVSAVLFIKSLVIIAGPIHCYTFTAFKWGMKPTLAWIVISIAIPFIFTIL